MSVVEPSQGGGAGAQGVSMIGRVKGLLFTPTAALDQAKTERPSLTGLLLGYLAPLVALAAIASLVGGILFEGSFFGFSIKQSWPLTLLNTAVYAALILIMTWLMAQVIDGLAANFGGVKDPVRAGQTAVYAGTGGLVLGLASTVPLIGPMIGLLGVLLSVMLLHKGLGVLMASPADRQVGFTATVILIMAVLWMVCGTIVAALTSPLRQAPMFSSAPTEVRTPWGKIENAGDGQGGGDGNVKVTIPGVGTINTGDLGGSIQVTGPDGKPVAPIATDKLKAFLPEMLPGGFKRGAVNTASGSAMGFGAASVNATYVSGAKSLDLSIADGGAVGQLGAGLAGAFGATVETQTEDGYTRVRTIDGRPTIEEYSKATGITRYVVLVGGRVAVSAEANGVDSEEMKRLIGAINLSQIEALAKVPE